MHRSRSLCLALLCALALGGCSNGAATIPTQPGAVPTVVDYLRSIPTISGGPAVPDGWPKKRQNLLFVADERRDKVLMYDPTVANPPVIGSISKGLSKPAGLAVDSQGDLFVVNGKAFTITAYHPGERKPYLTINNGLDWPFGIAIDASDDVFAANTDHASVVGYRAGATSPFETIDFSAYGQPTGLAFDANGNLWVACDAADYYAGGAVFEIPAGTTQVNYAGLTNLSGPVGIAFGPGDVMYVANSYKYQYGSYVSLYEYGSQSPSGTITDGITYATLGGFTSGGDYFQSNQFSNVVGFEAGGYQPFSTITGPKDPLGIAAWPLVSK